MPSAKASRTKCKTTKGKPPKDETKKGVPFNPEHPRRPDQEQGLARQAALALQMMFTPLGNGTEEKICWGSGSVGRRPQWK